MDAVEVGVLVDLVGAAPFPSPPSLGLFVVGGFSVWSRRSRRPLMIWICLLSFCRMLCSSSPWDVERSGLIGSFGWVISVRN